MLATSTRTLNILAAIVWYTGGFVLLAKSSSLIVEASSLHPDRPWHWVAAGAGLAAGGLKARYLFARACRKNLARISALPRPRVHQFYRPWFFAVLAVVSYGGARASRAAHGDYALLLAVAALDLSISAALLASSVVFWKERAFDRTGPGKRAGAGRPSA